ncbi:LysR family transcriptional regulator [Rhizobium leguminosarum bv. trifolii]|uniref:LysR family transcriptional regulator n=2 Tax=Rhizobium ruizarguesonis TaxID=2081791 RepID=A0AAE8QBS0_9HYPH|nr:LysR family transcriptional regulator [Rhizobium ruizarguesonis]MBY5884315.1 LysR family transcriptional regulator [Rhizobium leguminosarum]QIO44465.1 LysR family transcriptional regulator [Rhizobium leguminosarum bv. trifolii]TBY49149.1 LysR family transcriptional regulator [Rhizobium leguminosarum bv. viciae]MBC2802862.1 LysR family transcriptional regulator [Rhizobium ruizarguesonis]MBY5897911.1 LysR family transcriptional regulator [Rhizobium leguminosarum]
MKIPYCFTMIGREFTKIDWDDLRHFLALAQSGTLLGAAKQLGVEHATISRRVSSLETSLGRKLVDRRGRRIMLTSDGAQVARHAALVAAQTAAIEQLGRSSATELRGHVRISAPPALSSVLLAKPIAAVRRSHPGVEVTLVGEKRLASLNRREADIAVRMSRPEDGDYAIVKLGETSFHLYASKTYLETVSPPDWTFIGYDETMNASPQQLRLIELAAGRPIAVRSSVLEFQAATASLGAGVVMLPDFAVLESSGLQRIETEQPLTREVWLVVHSDIKDVPSVRVVVDALKNALGK